MFTQLPNWAKIIFGCLGTLGISFFGLEYAGLNLYLLMGAGLLTGILLFWRKEKFYAYGILAALLIEAGLFFLMIRAMVSNGL